MIVSIQHKGLKLLWTKGDRSKLPAPMVPKIERVLAIIDELELVPDDLQDLIFLRPHPLKGNLKGFLGNGHLGQLADHFQIQQHGPHRP